MSYQLFTDKANKFNCNIEIEGTSLAKSQVRLVIESDDMSYMFKGRIENTGICEVIIPKTKSFLSEGTIGNMRLEVIADDVYFEPWSSDFLVKTNKKVNVMVSEQVEERPKLKVEVYQQPEEPKPIVKETIVKPKPKIQESNSELPNEMIVKTKNGQRFKITKEQFLNNLHKNIG